MTLSAPPRPGSRRRTMARAAAVAAIAAASAALAATPAAAEVTDPQAQAAADRAVDWFRTEQDAATGKLAGFGGDWAMIALASAGVNSADLRAGAADPSLQDFFHGSWSGFGPGGLATDQERAILAGHAGGIQPSRVSDSHNLVAALAGFFDGRQLGSAALVTDDVFGLLALDRAGAAEAIAPTLAAEIRSEQQAGGGWSFVGGAGLPDVDVTGAAIGALCAAGAAPDDAAVGRALDYVAGAQDAATGGFASPFFGVNADSTSWVVSGLRRCGIDPQGARWTTTQGKTPLDYLVTLQKANGAFTWRAQDTADNLYSTQASVTALVGQGFAADAPARQDPTEPRLRPAPAVAAGTPVPLTLVLDHGPRQAGAERICSVTAPLGASVRAVLEAAAQATTPAYCVTGLALAGAGADARLTALNGVSAEPGQHVWDVAVDGEDVALSTPVGLGGAVTARLRTLGGAAPPPVELAPLGPGPGTTRAPRARALLPRGRTLRLARGGRLPVTVRCPRGLGDAGCQGVLRVRYRGAGRRLRTGGSRAFTVASGARRTVRVPLGRRLRRLIASRPAGLRVRLEGAVRDRGSGAVSVTRTSVVVRSAAARR